ncbi:nucleolar protein 3 [Anaerostipes hadrus]|uniref:Nucleolar protein 3 n=1 Tax=Anaerostipes hadrus TaxID=649756 RepID=A0A6N2SAB9_ANAHA
MSKKRIRVIGLFIAVLSLAVLSGCGSAKKKQKATTKTTEVASTTEKENISKNKDQQTITSSATTEATTKVTTSTAKKTTKATTETPIATKKDEQKAAVKATVTYNGFSDTNSVEMKMSDGSYEVMIVEKEDLIKKLEDLNPGTKVTIRYKAKAGQANKQIIAVF